MGEKYFTLKPGLDERDLFYLDPTILEMISFTAAYAHDYGVPCVITSMREDAPGRKTSTHKDGRAVDISVRGWNDFHIHSFMFKFKERFNNQGAYNKAGERRPIVYHKVKGSALHFHMQCQRRKSNLQGEVHESTT